jgi:hypothetical protein
VKDAGGHVVKGQIVVSRHDQMSSLDAEADIQKRIATQYRKRSPDVRRPPAQAESLLSLTFANDARAESQARVVQEDAAIHFADIDPDCMARDDGPDRTFDIERDTQVLGEVVHRAQRQHAQRLAGPDECRGDRGHRAVSASRDD